MRQASRIVSNSSRQLVTIKIDTNTLVEMFDSAYGNDFKIKNKLGFACDISKAIAEHLMNEGLDKIMNGMTKEDNYWMKMVGNKR